MMDHIMDDDDVGRGVNNSNNMVPQTLDMDSVALGEAGSHYVIADLDQ